MFIFLYLRENNARGGEHGEVGVVNAIDGILEVHGNLANLGIGVATSQQVLGEGVIRVHDALGHDSAQLAVGHVQPDGDLALLHLVL